MQQYNEYSIQRKMEQQVRIDNFLKEENIEWKKITNDVLPTVKKSDDQLSLEEVMDWLLGQYIIVIPQIQGFYPFVQKEDMITFSSKSIRSHFMIW
jgi:hypothetical protein